MLESSILKLINKKGKNYRIKELEKMLAIKSEEERSLLNTALKNLQMDGKIYINDKGYFMPFPKEYKIGTLEMSRSGIGRVRTDKGYIKIDPNDLENAVDKDLVVVSNIYNDGTLNGKIKKIVDRYRNSIVCEYKKRGTTYTLKPNISNKNLKLDIDSKSLKNLVDGDYVKVDMSIDIFGKTNPTIIEKIGHRDDPEIDIKNVAAEYDIDIDFSKEAREQLKTIPTTIEGMDITKRVDLRDKDFVTIDCTSTKDMDDAVYIEGNKIFISIADVDEFIPLETPLYNEAYKRSTSWYPFNKCIPMFPHEVSNGICSLNEGEDRFTLTYEITLDDFGKMIDYDVYQSVINSKKKMTYDDVNLILEQKIVPNGYEPFVEMLKNLEKVSKKLQRLKEQSGYIDFYRPDVDYILDENNNIIDIKPTYQHTAEKIIENLMVAGNVALMMYVSHIYDTAIYRVHDRPNEEKLEEMIDFVNGLGLDVKISKNNLTAKELQDLLKKVNGKEYAPIISELILRSMARARYDTNNIGHFALGNIPYYGHTTSPIRRFVDLMTQTMVKKYQNGEFILEPEIFEEQLQEIAEYASFKERKAKEAEIEVNKMKMAEYMAKQEGRLFSGVISYINETGAYARINDVIEGKIYLNDIAGDSFQYDARNGILVGKHTKEIYRIGQNVLLQVKAASKSDRTINYSIPNNFSKEMDNNKNERLRKKQRILAKRKNYS